MGKSFYDQARLLDAYKSKKNPSPEQVKVVLPVIRDEKFARYFFNDLDNPVWIKPLYKNQYFSKPPDPVEVEPGSYQLPGWPAGEYLARFADQYEEIVMDVIRSSRTENWRVQETLLDALLKISPAKAAELVYVVDSWLSGRFSDMLPIKLESLANYLIDNGYLDAAVQILESIITPVLPPDKRETSKYRSPVRFRSDHYWVNEYCDKQLHKLMSINPGSVVATFERQIERAIELTKQMNPDDAELQVGYYWRIDIPNRSSERKDADAIDILIDGFRDGLAFVCKQSIKEGERLLNNYLNSEHLIFQRIGLYTLRTYGRNYVDLVNESFLQRHYLENGKYRNEYCGLMRNQFDTASEEVKKTVISWILSGPSDADSREKRHAQRENREATDEDLQGVRDKWALYHLEIIRDFLSGDALSRLNELTALHGRPDVVERPHVVTTSWGGALSPVPAEELVKKSFDELKQLFLTYVPEDLFMNPRERLAETFQGLVHENPNRYGAFAAFLIDPGIRFIYIYHYLSGFREGIKSKNAKFGDAILDLCDYVVKQQEDPFEKSSGEYEPGLFAAQMEVVRLLEEALHSDDPYLSREQLNRIRSLLITLSHHPDPEIGEDAKTSFDPFTHSLNCVRGQAMHTIVNYSLFVIRRQEKQTGQKLEEGYLEPEVRQVLEEKLDIVAEPSLAVHSVFGAFVPQLYYLSSEWLEQNLPAIFPDDEENSAYWKAAWDAYIFASNVYHKVFMLLEPQYRRGLKLLDIPHDEQVHLGGSPNERLAQHMMFAYLSGLTGFGHENGLLDLFFSNAPDQIRAGGIFWLSQVLGNDKPSAEDELWKKCWVLWQKRLEVAEAQEISRNTHEISEYMRWLKNCPIDIGVLFPTLEKTVKYLHDGYDARQLIEYAANYCEDYPLEAASLLQMTILSPPEPWWSPKADDEEKILRIAIASMDEEAMQIARKVINYRGERGDFRWKYLLD